MACHLMAQWLWAKHNVGYNKLPGFFIAFDIMEKETGRFLSHSKLMQRLGSQIPCVPLLWQIETDSSQQEEMRETFFDSLIKLSTFGSERAEGVYLRIENDEYVVDRYKFRRRDFTSGRSDFDTNVINNTLLG